MSKWNEDAVEREARHKACEMFFRPRNAKYVTCVSHGNRAHVLDVLDSNNYAIYPENFEVTCDPSHPRCWPEAAP